MSVSASLMATNYWVWQCDMEEIAKHMGSFSVSVWNFCNFNVKTLAYTITYIYKPHINIRLHIHIYILLFYEDGRKKE